MQHLDDGTIHARLDGALGADDAQGIDAHVSACGACADRVAEARGLIAASSRILMALDDVPAGVVPPAQARTAAAVQAASPAFAVAPPAARHAAPPARWWGMRYSRLAAALAFVAAGTFLVARGANRREAVQSRPRPSLSSGPTASRLRMRLRLAEAVWNCCSWVPITTIGWAIMPAYCMNMNTWPMVIARCR